MKRTLVDWQTNGQIDRLVNAILYWVYTSCHFHVLAEICKPLDDICPFVRTTSSWNSTAMTVSVCWFITRNYTHVYNSVFLTSWPGYCLLGWLAGRPVGRLVGVKVVELSLALHLKVSYNHVRQLWERKHFMHVTMLIVVAVPRRLTAI